MTRPWTVALGGIIDPTRSTPFYLQIVQGLVHEIERGRLNPGVYLPSSRELADRLGVNRKTVVLAYEDLVAQGWLAPDGTRGTRVADDLPVPRPARGRAVADARAPAYRFRAPPARPLALASEAALRLDEGSPDGRLFPHDILARAYRTAIERAGRRNRLLYRDPRGSPALRSALAGMLAAERGLPVTDDHVCITRGSQNAIFLAAATLLSPGDVVLVENLTYEPAVAAFQACSAHIVPVALGPEGVDVEDVERKCREHRVRAIFLTPHHQFPTTASLAPERRARLLQLAHRFDFAIIEDDYDHEFHFGSDPLLPMAGFAPDRVIYVGSLSKLLLPALRVGYIAAPPAFIEAVAHTVSVTDGMGNVLTEDATADLIESGEVRRHARKAMQVYARRRLAFAETLARRLGGLVETRTPDGGLAFWLRFPDPADLDRIEARAPGLGLAIASSRSFAAGPEAERGLRVGFASLTEAEADRAIAVLASAAAPAVVQAAE